MTTRIPRDTVNDNEIVMRRVTRTGVTRDEDQGTIRPSSDAFLQGGPEGNVSVYLASETTPERITREFPDTYVALVEVSFAPKGSKWKGNQLSTTQGTAT